jgi:hypothetical protein
MEEGVGNIRHTRVGPGAAFKQGLEGEGEEMSKTSNQGDRGSNAETLGQEVDGRTLQLPGLSLYPSWSECFGKKESTCAFHVG